MSSIDDAVDTLAKHLDIEIDQQTKAVICQLQVGEYLGTVNGKYVLNCLDLDDDVSDYKIQPVAALHLKTPVLHGE